MRKLRNYLRVHYLQYLLIKDVSSDFISGKEEIDLLSLISFGIKFQSFAP